VSSYDDPRWHEQPETHDNAIPPSEQPEPVQPAHPQFEPFPRHQNTNSYPSSPPPQRRKGRKFGQFVILLALLLITFLGGWFGNQLYANSFNPSNQSQAYSNLFQQAWSIVDQHYVDRKAVDYKQMSYKAIQSMLDVLHDKGHTRFLTPQDVQAENQQLSGTFTGVGIYLHQDPKTKQLIITSPIPGSPAEKAGLKHGDIITAINNVSTAGKDIPGVSSLIQGKAGTSVTITVQRPSTGQILNIPVVRA